jgi:hypothetical protein
MQDPKYPWVLHGVRPLVHASGALDLVFICTGLSMNNERPGLDHGLNPKFPSIVAQATSALNSLRSKP